MSVKRIVPDIASKQMTESREFYTEILGLEVAMDMDWVITLQSPANPTAQITLMTDVESEAPTPQMSIEVEDIDEVYKTAVESGKEIVYPITNEPWGVRRFFISDPNGVVINVMTHL